MWAGSCKFFSIWSYIYFKVQYISYFYNDNRDAKVKNPIQYCRYYDIITQDFTPFTVYLVGRSSVFDLVIQYPIYDLCHASFTRPSQDMNAMTFSAEYILSLIRFS